MVGWVGGCWAGGWVGRWGKSRLKTISAKLRLKLRLRLAKMWLPQSNRVNVEFDAKVKVLG